jgi:ribonuclease HII
MPLIPTHKEEQELYAQGFRNICGIDEVGRGCLAGPIMAGAVILPNHFLPNSLSRVRDSKALSAKSRSFQYKVIMDIALFVGIGVVEADEIDKLGINPANDLAMVRSVQKLTHPPDFLLVDAVKIAGLSIPSKSIIHGDAICLSIACASIMAKVSRDNVMIAFDEVYPEFRFGSNKGYGTKLHLEALRNFGPTFIHRKSFSPVNKF